MFPGGKRTNNNKETQQDHGTVLFCIFFLREVPSPGRQGRRFQLEYIAFYLSVSVSISLLVSLYHVQYESTRLTSPPALIISPPAPAARHSKHVAANRKDTIDQPKTMDARARERRLSGTSRERGSSGIRRVRGGRILPDHTLAKRSTFRKPVENSWDAREKCLLALSPPIPRPAMQRQLLQLLSRIPPSLRAAIAIAEPRCYIPRRILGSVGLVFQALGNLQDTIRGYSCSAFWR